MKNPSLTNSLAAIRTRKRGNHPGVKEHEEMIERDTKHHYSMQAPGRIYKKMKLLCTAKGVSITEVTLTLWEGFIAANEEAFKEEMDNL